MPPVRSSSARPVALLAPSCLVAVLLAFVLALPGRALAQTPPPGASDGAEQEVVHSWSLAPAGNEGGAGDRPNLSYELAPGTEAKDAVTLFNYSNVQLTFDVYGTDAFNNADGSFNLLAGDASPTDVGSWITLDLGQLTIPPGTQATIPFTIRVPADARPGDHVGAVLAASKALGTGPDNKIVELDRRTGSRVYVRVAGPLQAELSVEDLETSYDSALSPLGGTARIRYQVTNTGNVRLAGTARTSVAAPLGVLRRTAADVEVAELLPGESMTVTRTVARVAATGLSVADVEIEPRAVDGTTDADLQSARRSGYALALPISLLALGLIVVLVRFMRRAHRRHQEALPLGSTSS